jgi:hypothetical protein
MFDLKHSRRALALRKRAYPAQSRHTSCVTDHAARQDVRTRTRTAAHSLLLRCLRQSQYAEAGHGSGFSGGFRMPTFLPSCCRIGWTRIVQPGADQPTNTMILPSSDSACLIKSAACRPPPRCRCRHSILGWYPVRHCRW